MVRAISNFGSGYKPPSYNALRGELLQKAVADVDRLLDVWRFEGKKTGFVLTSERLGRCYREAAHQCSPVNAQGRTLRGGQKCIRWAYSPPDLCFNACKQLINPPDLCSSLASSSSFLSLCLCCQEKSRMHHT